MWQWMRWDASRGVLTWRTCWTCCFATFVSGNEQNVQRQLRAWPSFEQAQLPTMAWLGHCAGMLGVLTLLALAQQ